MKQIFQQISLFVKLETYNILNLILKMQHGLRSFQKRCPYKIVKN